MPELPEVETIRRQLHAKLKGAKLKHIEVLRTGRERPAGVAFVQALTGRSVRSVDRRAKLLIWSLDNEQTIVAHLKMTGRFLFVDKQHQVTKHDAIRFTCENKKGAECILIWNDMRKFGFMEVVSPEKLQAKLTEYGPEPLDHAAAILAGRLLTPKTRFVKAALLDQRCIAGIGNIYADEACHRARIHPKRRLGSLDAKERLALAKAIQTVLTESIAQRGTSAHTYMDTEGIRGGFLSLLRVYGRTGKPCRACKTPIEKFRLVQRGTHVCPACQPEKT